MKAKEFLKQISPDEKYGIRADLQKYRLRSLVENIMTHYADHCVSEAVKEAHSKENKKICEVALDFVNWIGINRWTKQTDHYIKYVGEFPNFVTATASELYEMYQKATDR